MKLKAVIHESDEGGFWADVPELPGCCAQGHTREELLSNLREAAEGCLACMLDDQDAGESGPAASPGDVDRTIEIVE